MPSLDDTMTPERLALIPFFAHLKAETRGAVLEVGELRDYASGDTIIARNQVTAHFIFLIEGQWTARRFVTGTTEPLIWTESRPGTWLSGIAALDTIAPADVFADKQTTMLSVPRDDLLAIVPSDPALAQAILKDIHVWAERLDVHAALMAARS
jgi:CRP-like cAMP-binding protein